MGLLPRNHRRQAGRTPERMRRFLPRLEALEERLVLSPGIYLENFENDPINPTGPVDPATAVAGFDAAGDFKHTFSGGFNFHEFRRITGTTTADAMPSL